jgi:hypothetical protein
MVRPRRQRITLATRQCQKLSINTCRKLQVKANVALAFHVHQFHLPRLISPALEAQGSRILDRDVVNTNVTRPPFGLYTTNVDRLAYMFPRRRHGLPTACQRR